MSTATRRARYNWNEEDVQFLNARVTNDEGDWDEESLRLRLRAHLSDTLGDALTANEDAPEPQAFAEVVTDVLADFLLNYFVPKRDKLGRFARTAGGAAGTASGLGSKDLAREGRHLHGVDIVSAGEVGGFKTVRAARKDPLTHPEPERRFHPDVEERGEHGVTKSARVGVPADQIPPPPKIGQLPNLTPHERSVEKAFIDHFERDPDKVSRDFLEMTKRNTKSGEPPTFGTDDAKVLHPAWGHPELSLEDRSKNRATLNLALHQTANAIAKRAFLQHLDSLQAGDEVLVTVGGCGAGKGYALKNVPEALSMKQKAKAVWDSAGDQNATENVWLQRELQKRGLRGNYVFVHTDPYKQWADPEKGVVKRAQDVNDGRMVDAKVFADSYALGAKNHHAFYEANKDNPNASFVFLDNRGKPKLISGMPPEALSVDRNDLAAHALKVVNDQPNLPPHVKRGATMGTRVWGATD